MTSKFPPIFDISLPLLALVTQSCLMLFGAPGGPAFPRIHLLNPPQSSSIPLNPPAAILPLTFENGRANG